MQKIYSWIFYNGVQAEHFYEHLYSPQVVAENIKNTTNNLNKHNVQ